MKNLSRKVVSICALLTVFIFLVSCIDYKPYANTEANGSSQEESNITSEIAAIEKELVANEEKEVNDTVEEAEAVLEEVKENIAPEKELNLPPLQRLEVKENELVNLAIKVTDPNKDIVNYTFSLPLNDQGKWKTNYGDAGEYVVTITATDGKLATKKDVLLVIERVNVPPMIKDIKDTIVKEGETVTLKPEAIDPNGDPVTIKISQPLETGVWATDYTNGGEYVITIDASDGELSSTKTFHLTVTDVNQPPVISGLEDMTVNEGDKVLIAPKITDLDTEDKVTVTISDPVGDSGEWQTSYTDHGEYDITVKATDGKDAVTKTAKLVVLPKNMPPEISEVRLS